MEPPSPLKKRLLIALEVAYILLIMTAVMFADTRTKSEILPFLLLPGLFFALSEFLLKNDLMKHERLRFMFLYMIVTLPTSSYYTGTKNAYKIYDCREFQYSTNMMPNDTLKFLGKASDYYIFVSLDNQDKFIFSTEGAKGLKLQQSN